MEDNILTNSSKVYLHIIFDFILDLRDNTSDGEEVTNDGYWIRFSNGIGY